MTNAGHTLLVCFNRAATKFVLKPQHRRAFSIWMHRIHQSPPYSNSLCLSYAVCSRILLEQRRFVSGSGKNHSTADENKSDEKSPEDDSASFHRQYKRYHRQSYQQKKSQKRREDSSPSEYMNHYQRLNIEPDADSSAIKSAYYSMSKLYHPDIVGNDDKNSGENFRLITESYDILIDQDKRADYDDQLKAATKLDNNLSNFGSTSAKPNSNINPLYRTRNANVIFRHRMDMALKQEKLKNPQKFRAGSFARSLKDVDLDVQAELVNLSKRIKSFESGHKNTRDGSDFYRAHLCDMLRRRQEDLLEYRDFGFEKSSAQNDSDAATILTSLGVIFGIFVVTIFAVSDLDIGDYLDKKLKFHIDPNETPTRDKT